MTGNITRSNFIVVSKKRSQYFVVYREDLTEIEKNAIFNAYPQHLCEFVPAPRMKEDNELYRAYLTFDTHVYLDTELIKGNADVDGTTVTLISCDHVFVKLTTAIRG